MAVSFLLVVWCAIAGLLDAKNANPKRGFVADGCTGSNCSEANLLNASGWFYSYHVSDPYHGSIVPDETARFTPMHWCSNVLNATIFSFVCEH